MDLLERYLQAVGQYLPAETKADTLAELRANLLAEMDDRAEELGRPLTDADAISILRAHGKPTVVALRYLPQRSLIGPTIYPFYRFATIKALPLIVLIYAIAQGATLLATLDLHSASSVLISAALNLVPTLLIYWASMTISFAIVEEVVRRYGVPSKWMEWNPAKLPPVKPEAPGPKSKSLARKIFELCIHCLWMAYVISIPWHAYWRIGPGIIGIDIDSFGVRPAPIWHTFYLLLVILLSVQLVMKLMGLQDGSERWVKPMEIFTNLLGVVAIGMMAVTRVYFVPSGAVDSSHVPPGFAPLDAALHLQRISQVNEWMSLSFRIALLAAVIGLGVEAWKYRKRYVPAKRLAFR